jgi:hypothetical protein
MSDIPSVSEPEVTDRRQTRSSSTFGSTPPLVMISSSTQTHLMDLRQCEFPQVTTRLPSSVKGKKGHLIQPSIIEALVEAETTARCPMDVAIKVVQITANKIFQQNWLLPLTMDGSHLHDVKLLKGVQEKCTGKM